MHSFEELRQIELPSLDHAANHLNPIADLEARAREMLAAGNDEALVAVQCGVTLSKVFEIRRGVQPTAVTNRAAASSENTTELPSAKELFARRMRDFDECTEIAIQEFKNDPSSETAHVAMNGFMKTMESLYKSYQDLDDPQETAERVIKQIVFPYMNAMTRVVAETFKSIAEEIGPSFVSDFQREQLSDSLRDAGRKMSDATRNEFNRAVKTLEVVYGAKLDSLYMKPSVAKRDETLMPSVEEKERVA
jgi:hypothetical protein